MNSFFKQKIKHAIHGKRITVTGSTKNIEGHAAVVADNTGIYYVEGLSEWEQSWLGQTVKMTGDLANKDNGDTGQNIKSAIVVLV